jgi:hypothetical protein
MPEKLESKQLAITFAVWSALFMLVLWLLANMGIYVSAAEQMAKWHVFFNLTFSGLVAGIIEAAIVSYVLVLAFVWVYNWVGEKI